VFETTDRHNHGPHPESLTQNAVNEMGLFGKIRHARPCAGHPRLAGAAARKTWMAGTSPAMTKKRVIFKQLERA
jgi:hypothetical protein